MKSMIIIVFMLILGIIVGRLDWLDTEKMFLLNVDNVLWILLFLIGIITFANMAIEDLKKISFKILLVPFTAILGMLIGVFFVKIFINRSLWDLMAVGSGFGYYSLSSVIIKHAKGAELGALALLTNIFRELLTLIFTPLFVKHFGPLSPIVSGGATSMDVTLPMIVKYAGVNYTFVALINGTILSLLVPFIVSFFVSL